MSYKYVFFVGTYMISINYYFYRIYEHKELRPIEFINSNSKLHPSTARKALRNLTKLNLLERYSDSLTSPNTYYTLKK